jgi:hypothetical protein
MKMIVGRLEYVRFVVLQKGLGSDTHANLPLGAQRAPLPKTPKVRDFTFSTTIYLTKREIEFHN